MRKLPKKGSARLTGKKPGTDYRKLKSPLSGYYGGKALLAGRIIEQIPQHVCYVEPFCGAAWVLFQKAPSKIEVLNDVNDDIVNFFEVIRDNWQGFMRRASFFLKSRKLFNSYKDFPQRELPALERAFRYWYLLKNSFGGRMSLARRKGRLCYNPSYGYDKKDFPYQFRPPSLSEITAWHRRLAKVNLENEDWRDILTRYDAPGTFFFLDPPYYGCEKDYGGEWFGREDFFELAKACQKLQGKFLLTLNDEPEICEIFSAFHIERRGNFFTFNYSAKGLHQELFIRNY